MYVFILHCWFHSYLQVYLDMPQHKGFRAWIECEGVALEEYGGEVDPSDNDVYNVWVASEAGKVSSYLDGM